MTNSVCAAVCAATYRPTCAWRRALAAGLWCTLLHAVQYAWPLTSMMLQIACICLLLACITWNNKHVFMFCLHWAYIGSGQHIIMSFSRQVSHSCRSSTFLSCSCSCSHDCKILSTENTKFTLQSASGCTACPCPTALASPTKAEARHCSGNKQQLSMSVFRTSTGSGSAPSLEVNSSPEARHADKPYSLHSIVQHCMLECRDWSC